MERNHINTLNYSLLMNTWVVYVLSPGVME